MGFPVWESRIETNERENPMADKKKWYVVAVSSDSTEEKVKAELTKQSRIQSLERKIGSFFVPRHLEPRVVSGQNKLFRVKSFPGYLLIRMEWNDDVHVLVHGIRGVMGVLPLGGRDEKDEDGNPIKWVPCAAETKEIAILQIQHKASAKKPKGESQPKPRVPRFSIGDEIEIISGMWKGQEAKIVQVDEEKQTVKIPIVMLGKATDISINMNQIKKA